MATIQRRAYAEMFGPTVGDRVIGSGGERLKRIGTQARQDLEALLDARVFVELWVKVRSGWADDDAHLRSYGYE